VVNRICRSGSTDQNVVKAQLQRIRWVSPAREPSSWRWVLRVETYDALSGTCGFSVDLEARSWMIPSQLALKKNIRPQVFVHGAPCMPQRVNAWGSALSKKTTIQKSQS